VIYSHAPRPHVPALRSVALGLAVSAALALVGGALPAAARAQSAPAQSAPAVQEQLALDNACVRVALLTFPPGVGSGLHLNAEPELGIVVSGELTVITRRGKERLGPGQVAYLEPLTVHDAINEGAVDVKLWALNLKKCE
jgi:quercetin dioxygenase-like cupin family protein